MSSMKRTLSHLWPPVAMVICFWLICYSLCPLMGESMFGSSVYNSYTLQAMAWREGRLALEQDHPHLELAIFNGDYYVSFPPVPTVPMYLLTFFCDVNTPDALMVKLYAMVAMLAIYATLAMTGWRRNHAAFLSLMMTLGGSMLPLVMNGAVWYQAQTMAFLFTTLAIALMAGNRPTPALACYALAVGCRPFNVCYGPLLMLAWHLAQPNHSLQRTARTLWPGVAVGLAIAALYAVYNNARFGNPLEFGHNYLPEFTRSQYGQFSLQYAAQNARRFLLELPMRWDGAEWTFERFGASVFLSNPALLIVLGWYVSDLVRRRATITAHCTLLLFAAHLFLLLLHRTGGGYQLGARYAVDLVPYGLIYLWQRSDQKALHIWEIATLAAGFALFFCGSAVIHV